MAKRSLDPSRPDDRQTIMRHPTRLAVARLCRRGPKTIAELCRLLGMEDGALRGTVKQMERWKLLIAVRASSKRGQAYVFSLAWDRELARAVRRYQPLDLQVGQRVLFLKGPPPSDVNLADVAWMTGFDDAPQTVLAIAEDSDSAALALRDELEQRGVETVASEVRFHRNPA